MKAIELRPDAPFGRWTVVSFAGRNKHGQRTYLCRCNCGVEATVIATALITGRSKSCGCYQRDVATSRTTHGMTNSKEYKSWAHMLDRCRNPKNPAFTDYGGRGITVCQRWLSFGNFLADMGPMPRGGRYTIDRFPDNDGPYAPD